MIFNDLSDGINPDLVDERNPWDIYEISKIIENYDTIDVREIDSGSFGW